MKKLTRLEKQWILYDVGNSAFIMLVSTIIPIYFKNVASGEGVSLTDSTAYWGYAASVSTLIVALIGPVLGTLSDTKGFKKPIFAVFMMTGVIGCAALAVPVPWIVFLIVFVIAKTGYSGSLIFYDSMLTDITEPDRMDEVSSQGYAWGYIGSCIPFIISLLLVLNAEKAGITTVAATMAAFVINAVWWLVVTIPLLKNYEQKYYVETEERPFKESFRRLGTLFKEIRQYKKAFLFLLAFFFYIDGVYTIIEMATSYGKDVGIDDNQLLLALLLTQIVAFPCAVLFGRAAQKYKNELLIKICIGAYFCITLFAVQLDKVWEFWFLAVCVGMFQGGIQALSRSYFAQIIPPKRAGEFFGILDICGKGASFFGTLLVGIFTQLTGSSKIGVGMLAALFAAGFILFDRTVKTENKAG